MRGHVAGMAPKTKVIVVGDLRGDLSTVLARVGKLNAAGKGPFGVVFCVGAFARNGDSARVEQRKEKKSVEDEEEGEGGGVPTFVDYLTGRATLPFHLYFLLSGEPQDAALAATLGLGRDRQQVAPGITFLGQAGVSTVACGLRVAALSGQYDRATYRSATSPVNAANGAPTDDAVSPPAFRSHYCKSDIDAMLGSAEAVKPVDLFLSCEWGEGYDALIPPSDVRPLPHALSPVVADLARRLMPRHHLVTGKFCFFKLAPYVNTDSTDGTSLHATRFVALGSVPDAAGAASAGQAGRDTNSIKKKKAKPAKWMHALNLEPMSGMSAEERNKAVSGATTCPYLAFLLRKIGSGGHDSSGGTGAGAAGPSPADAANAKSLRTTASLLRPVGAPPSLLEVPASMPMPMPLPLAPPPQLFDASRAALLEMASDAQSKQDGALQRFAQPRRKRRRDGGGGGGRHDQHPMAMNNARRQKRKLIAPRMDCWFCCASPACETHLIVSIAQHMYLTAPKGALSPGHMLIVPVAHLASMADADADAREEIRKYKDSLRAFYAKHDEVPIFVERCIKTKGPQQHAYIEAIPMPKDAAAKLLPGAFAEECKASKMEFELVEASEGGLAAAAPEDRQYFHIEMPSRIELLFAVPPERGSAGGKNMVHLQFARKVACRVLGCPERMHWKSCVVGPQVEMQLANEFKGAFGGGGFDWTAV